MVFREEPRINQCLLVLVVPWGVPLRIGLTTRYSESIPKSGIIHDIRDDQCAWVVKIKGPALEWYLGSIVGVRPTPVLGIDLRIDLLEFWI